MANLPKLTLSYDEHKGDWTLKKDFTLKTVRRFETKTDATKGGVLEKVLGEEGGSVKIQKQNGVYQEERTYPRSKDPRKSRG
jgi:hypothetical protein